VEISAAVVISVAVVEKNLEEEEIHPHQKTQPIVVVMKNFKKKIKYKYEN
jgi:hypothetical protein